MTTDRQKIGRRGEEIAEEYLTSLGYQVIERNWKPKKWGEIDLIALEKDSLVFVEVKARRRDPLVKPQETVESHKIAALKRTGQLYSLEHPDLPSALRLDVVGIELDERGQPVSIELFKDAPGTFGGET